MLLNPLKGKQLCYIIVDYVEMHLGSKKFSLVAEARVCCSFVIRASIHRYSLQQNTAAINPTYSSKTSVLFPAKDGILALNNLEV